MLCLDESTSQTNGPVVKHSGDKSIKGCSKVLFLFKWLVLFYIFVLHTIIFGQK